MQEADIERWSKEKIEAFQELRLRDALDYVMRNSAFYQNYFADIDISKILSLADLQSLPFTNKDHLHAQNDDFLCVPRSKVVDFASTSGTSGSPVTFALTDADLDRLAYNEALSLECSGVKKGDTVQLMTTLDRQFMAGLAYFLGMRKLGASVVRVGAGIPGLQWDAIEKYKPTYLITVPSFLVKMIEYAESYGIDYKNSSVVGAVCIGEPLRNEDFSPNALANKISEKWDINLFSTYASTEMSTAFAECEAMEGGHHHPDLIIVEVVDEDGNQVEEGQSGELVVTTLGVEAMPLVRFKTGDIVAAHYGSCSCGRNSLRLGSVIGRKQQMIKYKGTTLYPPAMNNLLNEFSEIEGHLIEVSSDEVGMDEITIKIASSNTTVEFLNLVKDHFRAKLRVAPKVVLLETEELNKQVFPPKSRKPIRFVDYRTL